MDPGRPDRPRQRRHGVGEESYLACALGHQACRLGISTRYYRVSCLLDELTLARGDGSYPKFIQRLARTWLLILDRLLNNAHRITLKGASMRRLYDSTKTDSTS